MPLNDWEGRIVQGTGHSFFPDFKYGPPKPRGRPQTRTLPDAPHETSALFFGVHRSACRTFSNEALMYSRIFDSLVLKRTQKSQAPYANHSFWWLHRSTSTYRTHLLSMWNLTSSGLAVSQRCRHCHMDMYSSWKLKCGRKNFQRSTELGKA